MTRKYNLIYRCSAVFSALFGTPLTATVFAMEVISVGIIYYSAFNNKERWSFS